MLLTRRGLFRIFFMGEVVVFLSIYFFGGHGLRKISVLSNNNKQFELENKKLLKEVKELENTVCVWQQNSFYKEKIARERLHMAHKGDILYLTT